MHLFDHFFQLQLKELRVKEATLAMDSLSEADRRRTLEYSGKTLWLMMRGLCDLLVNRLGVPQEELRSHLLRRLENLLQLCSQCHRVIPMHSASCVYCDVRRTTQDVSRPRAPVMPSPLFFDPMRKRLMFEFTDYLLSARLNETEQHLADLANDVRSDELRTRLLGQSTTELAAIAQGLCDVITEKLGVSVAELMQAIERHACRTPMTCPGCGHQIAVGVNTCIYCGRRREAGLATASAPAGHTLPDAVAPALHSRAATADDFPAILALNARFESVLEPLDRTQLAALHAEAALHQVIERNGEVVAFVIALRDGARCDSPRYRWFVQRCARLLYVERIVVAPEAQSLGAGGRLYAAVYAMARAERVPFIGADFDSDPPNPAMERFYLRMGFREIARGGLGGGKKTRSRQLLDVLQESTGLAGWAARQLDGATSPA